MLMAMLGKRVGLVMAQLLPYILALGILVLSGWLLWNNGFNRGVELTEIKYEKLILKERNRQIDVNQEAIEQAKLRAIELERLLNVRDAQISDLLKQSAADPNSQRTAIGVDSVSRINSISGTTDSKTGPF